MHFSDFENYANRFLQERGVRDPRVFTIIMLVALLVVGARMFAPFQVGKDQASQLEAAENLANGRGLITTAVGPASYDISVTPNVKYVTWWPPGFSIIVALFLKLGFSLLLSLKLIYGAVSLLGWIGWGILVGSTVAQPAKIVGRTYPIHLLLAALLPVLFTMAWDGTDIFLWAGIPFIFIWLFRQGEHPSYKAVAAAGLILGAVCSIRHASYFLGLFGFFVLLQVYFPDYKAALKRFAVFVGTASLFIIPTCIYLKAYASGVAGITDRATFAVVQRDPLMMVRWVVRALPMNFSIILGFPLLDQLIYKTGLRWLMRISGVLAAAILISLPVILIRNRKSQQSPFQRDILVSISLLMLSLPAFLVAVDVTSAAGLMGVRRYYEPLALCSLLLFYPLATATLSHPVLARVARVIVFAFVLNLIVFLPAQAFIGDRGGFLVKKVLGYVPTNDTRYRGTSHELSYPSLTMFSNKEASRQKIRQLAQANPDALFFVEEYPYFVYDGFARGGPTPGKNIRAFPHGEYWNRAYTTVPLKLFWVVNDGTNLDFMNNSDHELVFSDSVERIKIIRAELPAGHRFQTITPPTHIAQN